MTAAFIVRSVRHSHHGYEQDEQFHGPWVPEDESGEDGNLEAKDAAFVAAEAFAAAHREQGRTATVIELTAPPQAWAI